MRWVILDLGKPRVLLLHFDSKSFSTRFPLASPGGTAERILYSFTTDSQVDIMYAYTSDMAEPRHNNIVANPCPYSFTVHGSYYILVYIFVGRKAQRNVLSVVRCILPSIPIRGVRSSVETFDDRTGIAFL